MVIFGVGSANAEAEVLAIKSGSLDNSDPWAHLALGFVAYTKRLTNEAVEEFQRALDSIRISRPPMAIWDWRWRLLADLRRPLRIANRPSYEPARSADRGI